MSGDDGTFLGLGVYIGADAWVTCHHYEGKTPILVITAGGSSVSISPAGREASATAAGFARALLGRVQEFADDIERLHAAQHPDTGADSSGTDDADDTTTADAHAA